MSDSASDLLQPVRLRGDSTRSGMRIRNLEVGNPNWAVRTTGALFRYRDGGIDISHGLGDDQTDIATLMLSGENETWTIDEVTPDHVLMHSQSLLCGIYGESVLLLAPREDISLLAQGRFMPEYDGRFHSELLLASREHGIVLYPSSPELQTGFKVLEPGCENWQAHYNLWPGMRMLVGAFPACPAPGVSDMLWVPTALPTSNVPAGTLPPPEMIAQMRTAFTNLVIMHHWIYMGASSTGMYMPYTPRNLAELKRFCRQASDMDVAALLYTSYFYALRQGGNQDDFIQAASDLVSMVGNCGLYLDGVDSSYGSRVGDRIASLEVVRRLRMLVDVLTIHGTALLSSGKVNPAAPFPNMEAHCNPRGHVIRGEGVRVTSVTDPWITFQAESLAKVKAAWHRQPGDVLPLQTWANEVARRGLGVATFSEIMTLPDGSPKWTSGLTHSYYTSVRDARQILQNQQQQEAGGIID